MRGFDAAHAASRKSAEHSVSFKASEGGSSPPEFVVEFGVPADKILKTAAERSVSLIVLGVRQQAGPGTDPRWEVTHRVACEAYCPVLTFRARYFE
jgi:nucleotide-binding universal stress UspA family protein